MPQKPIISIRDLQVTYLPGRSNEVKALCGISLDIFPGEYIIFFGPSGCGKSTLLYSIAGLERHISGDIVVQDGNLAHMNQHELERYHQSVVGMIFQSFYLIGSLTVEQNVALPQVAVRKMPQERLARARALLEKFGVGQQVKKLPTELSGGQQQRVAICRSIMNDPSIVIADEPVGNLDSKSSKDVMDLLRHLNDIEKKTVILVTHDPSHLNHAHRIFFLRDGKVIDTKVNTPEERAQAVVTSAMLQNAMKTMGGQANMEALKVDQTTEASKILAEAMVGMGADEMADLQKRIQHVLQSKKTDRRSITSFLTRAIARGGMGMAKHRASHIASEITTLIHELRQMERLMKKESTTQQKNKDDTLPLTVLESHILRQYLLDYLDIHVHNEEAVRVIEGCIQKNLEGNIGRPEMQKILCSHTRKKGAGLSPKIARLLARHIELMVLHLTKNSPTPSAPVTAPLPPVSDESE